MDERIELEQAIAALEAQRKTLGDTAVDAAIEGLRNKLDESGEPAEERRKQVTVLFADLVDYTSMASELDPEKLRTVIRPYFDAWKQIIRSHGGKIEKYIGDAVMAVFGLPTAREGDAERALRAALAMRDRLEKLNLGISSETGFSLSMRIGINTGIALVGLLETDGEMTVVGDTVNIASRLEESARPDGILISHDTYDHVRGIFEVTGEIQFHVKGKEKPIHAHRVIAEKPGGIRIRGLDGIDTPMLGRDDELIQLNTGLKNLPRESCPRGYLITGEAGVGKSRLVKEFLRGIGTLPREPRRFLGRCSPETMNTPYAAFRSMIFDHFSIKESLGSGRAATHLVSALSSCLNEEKARFVGHLIGIDFSDHQSIRRSLSHGTFGSTARTHVFDFFQALEREHTVILILEDLHWADESSLRLLSDLIRTSHGSLFILGTARPEFLKRHSGFKTANTFRRIVLKPLSDGVTESLIDTILSHSAHIPRDFRELILSRAEGNPFYVEELIRMFLEEGILRRVEDTWTVTEETLETIHIPRSLTEVLQARIDRLPFEQRTVLQRAATVGRIFWDRAVGSLKTESDPEIGIETALSKLEQRELVFPRETSRFHDTREYFFKHALLREVTYETILHENRKTYHTQIVSWLKRIAGDRLEENAGLIGEHLDRAGDARAAASWLLQAAKRAYASNSYPETIRYIKRVLALLDDTEYISRVDALLLIGTNYVQIDDHHRADSAFRKAQSIAKEHDLKDARINANIGLCKNTLRQGKFDEARDQAKEAVRLAEELEDLDLLGASLRMVADAEYFLGHYETAREFGERSLRQFESTGNQKGASRSIMIIGNAYLSLQNFDMAADHYERCLTIEESIGNRAGIASCLCNLGVTVSNRGDHTRTRELCRRSYEIFRDIRDQLGALSALLNVGDAHVELGEFDEGERTYQAVLDDATGGLSWVGLITLSRRAHLRIKQDRLEDAAKLLGYISNHPDRNPTVVAHHDQVLAALKMKLSAADLENYLNTGMRCSYEDIMRI